MASAEPYHGSEFDPNTSNHQEHYKVYQPGYSQRSYPSTSSLEQGDSDLIKFLKGYCLKLDDSTIEKLKPVFDKPLQRKGKDLKKTNSDVEKKVEDKVHVKTDVEKSLKRKDSGSEKSAEYSRDSYHRDHNSKKYDRDNPPSQVTGRRVKNYLDNTHEYANETDTDDGDEEEPIKVQENDRRKMLKKKESDQEIRMKMGDFNLDRKTMPRKENASEESLDRYSDRKSPRSGSGGKKSATQKLGGYFSKLLKRDDPEKSTKVKSKQDTDSLKPVKKSRKSDSGKNRGPFVPVVKRNICYIVAAVIVNDQNEVLLIQEAKATCHGQWYLPAGRVEPGESFIEGVKREVREEAGLEFEPTALVTVEVRGILWYRFIFTGYVTGGQLKTPVEKDEESLQAAWFPLAMLTDPKVPLVPLRGRDFMHLVYDVLDYQSLVTDGSIVNPILPILQSHNRVYLRVLFITWVDDDTKCYFLRNRSVTFNLPTIVVEPPDFSLHVILWKLFQYLFCDRVQHEVYGLISVEHDGGVSRMDGMCINMLCNVWTRQTHTTPGGGSGTTTNSGTKPGGGQNNSSQVESTNMPSTSGQCNKTTLSNNSTILQNKTPPSSAIKQQFCDNENTQTSTTPSVKQGSYLSSVNKQPGKVSRSCVNHQQRDKSMSPPMPDIIVQKTSPPGVKCEKYHWMCMSDCEFDSFTDRLEEIVHIDLSS